jgi:hypothetical protein
VLTPDRTSFAFLFSVQPVGKMVEGEEIKEFSDKQSNII